MSCMQLGEEDMALAQFWYDPHTLQCLQDQCRELDVECIALLSAPSLFFSLRGATPKTKDLKAKYDGDGADRTARTAVLFEYDRRWEEEEDFVFFDYREGHEAVDDALAGRFDLILADPPNLQMSTLQQYVGVIKKLRRSEQSKILFVTSADWGSFLFDALGLIEVKFKPFMPSSVWSQCGKFGLFSNYKNSSLSLENPAAPIETHEDSEADYTGYYLGLPAHDI